MLARRSARALLLLVALLLVLPAGPVAAHTALSSSSPGDGEQLPAPPAQVELVFTQAVLDLGTQVVVTAPSGPVDVATPVVTGERVAADLPPDLPAGEYVVQWRVTASDGHPITGELGFTAAAGATPPEGSPSTSGPPPTASAAEEELTPSPTVAASAAPVPGGDDRLSTPLLLGIAAAVIVAGVAAGVTMSQRRG